jgi:hypothetical protein
MVVLPAPRGPRNPVTRPGRTLWQDRGGAAGLGPGPLLDEQELTAGVVGAVLIEADDNLEREDQVAEQVAVQGVPVSGLVSEQDLRARLAQLRAMMSRCG